MAQAECFSFLQCRQTDVTETADKQWKAISMLVATGYSAGIDNYTYNTVKCFLFRQVCHIRHEPHILSFCLAGCTRITLFGSGASLKRTSKDKWKMTCPFCHPIDRAYCEQLLAETCKDKAATGTEAHWWKLTVPIPRRSAQPHSSLDEWRTAPAAVQRTAPQCQASARCRRRKAGPKHISTTVQWPFSMRKLENKLPLISKTVTIIANCGPWPWLSTATSYSSDPYYYYTHLTACFQGIPG